MNHFAKAFFRFSVICWGTMAALNYAQLGIAAGTANIPAQKARLVLTERPKRAAEPVLAVQQRLVAEKKRTGAPQTAEVLVRGQIGGMPNVWPETHPDFPWYKAQASIFLVDSKIAAQFAAHMKRHENGQECAFCKSLAARNAHAIAVVNFVDERGEILRVDARTLLDLKENQTVTIRGKAKLLAGSMLVIDADGIYVER